MVNGRVLYLALFAYTDRLVAQAAAAEIPARQLRLAKEVELAIRIAADLRLIMRIEGRWRDYDIPDIPAESGSTLSVVRAALQVEA